MQREITTAVFARKALTAQGWKDDTLITVDANGVIAEVREQARPPAGIPSFDLLLPGMANVHSHAFQRAMAGLAEFASGEGKDNFWSWRETMYGFTRRLTPEHIGIVAQALYIGMLKSGYTAVGEFHYLHHDAEGKPYAHSTELCDRIAGSARNAGIHLALLPVMYETGNFGGKPPHDGQKRFLHSVDGYLTLLLRLKDRYGASPNVTLGVAPHSLRAVTPEGLRTILGAMPDLGMSGCPIHMHIAEQEKEVADCLAWSGKRPVEWLLDTHAVDARWCLVHATHMTIAEAEALATTGATVGLCPTTEANLGDGIFQAEAYFSRNGFMGIGSDSNVCLSPFEELRMMEYAQRLALRKRNVITDARTPSAGRTLYERATNGGARALGIPAGMIAPGRRADCIALSTDAALLAGRKDDFLLDTLIFASCPVITDVFVAGWRVVENGVHPLEEASDHAWRRMAAETGL